MHVKDISIENLKSLYPKLKEKKVIEILDNREHILSLTPMERFTWRQIDMMNSDTFSAFRYIIDYNTEGSNFYNLIPEEYVQRCLKNHIFAENDILYFYFNSIENEAERKKPNERTLLDEILVYGIKYREDACNEAVGSMDPSW